MTLEPGYRSAVDNAASPLKVRYRCTGHVEVAEDVGVEEFVKLVIADLVKGRACVHNGGVVDEDIEMAELGQRAAYGRLARRALHFRRAL